MKSVCKFGAIYSGDLTRYVVVLSDLAIKRGIFAGISDYFFSVKVQKRARFALRCHMFQCMRNLCNDFAQKSRLIQAIFKSIGAIEFQHFLYTYQAPICQVTNSI